jgi:hypothetical protein
MFQFAPPFGFDRGVGLVLVAANFVEVIVIVLVGASGGFYVRSGEYLLNCGKEHRRREMDVKMIMLLLRLLVTPTEAERPVEIRAKLIKRGFEVQTASFKRSGVYRKKVLTESWTCRHDNASLKFIEERREGAAAGNERKKERKREERTKEEGRKKEERTRDEGRG